MQSNDKGRMSSRVHACGGRACTCSRSGGGEFRPILGGRSDGQDVRVDDASDDGEERGEDIAENASF